MIINTFFKWTFPNIFLSEMTKAYLLAIFLSSLGEICHHTFHIPFKVCPLCKGFKAKEALHNLIPIYLSF